MTVNTQSRERSNELDGIAAANRESVRIRLGERKKESARERREKRKERILRFFSAAEADWNDFRWQMEHRITDTDTLHAIFPLERERFEEIEAVGRKYRWAISPYYLSLLDANNILDPVGLMAVPSRLELEETGEADPMAEEFTRPAPLVTRRYPDRLILNVTNSCGMFCRFCQRKRNIRERDSVNRDGLRESIDFIRENKNIRDVLITGGDPLTLPTEYLDDVLAEVRAIPHVEIIRIGSRIPVTVPQRVDGELAAMLKKHHPLYVNVHFNHPNELTEDSVRACNRLADAGISLGNQMVLLNGVNNDQETVLTLNKELLKARVRPYYIFFAKNIMGATHFTCALDEGLDIVNFLRGNVSGMAIPTFIVNAPDGFGKVPILGKNYAVNSGTVELTTWEQRKITFKNPERKSIAERYEQIAN